MEYKGLQSQHTDKPWAKFVASPEEIETSKIGYLAAGKPEALDKFPAGGGAQQKDTYLNREKARHIVAGNIILMNQMSVSPETLVDSGVFDDVSEFVRSGVESLQDGAYEEANPPIRTEANQTGLGIARGISN